jgi:hypothetical protein
MKRSRKALTLLPFFVLGAALAWAPPPGVEAADAAEVTIEQSKWPIRNYETKWSARAAFELGPMTFWTWGGACAGMTMAVKADLLRRRSNPDAPGLLSITRGLDKAGARALAARAQSLYAANFEKTPRVKLTTETLLDKLVKGAHDYQVLDVRGSKSGKGHQVIVLNKPPVRRGDDFSFELYDVNAYNEERGVGFPVYLHYDIKTKKFYFKAEGYEGEPYGNLDLDTLYLMPVTEDDEIIKELGDLIEEAADGTLDGHTGSTGSLGGVALKTGVRPPAGFVLKSLGVSPDGKVRAGDGERSYEVAVDPAMLAVALQGAVLLEQTPWLSIGSEPSREAGKMRVSYRGFIRGTPVGRALLDADLKLKGLMVGAGLGPNGSPAPGVQDFLWSLPRPLASGAMRMWIVGSEVVIGAEGSRLVPRSHGLRLRYELALRGQTTDDEELERFVSRFNAKWGEIAEAVPELKRLEEVAFATAVVQWVRESGAQVDEALLAYPFAWAPTPEHVPAFCISANGLGGLEGGIALSGDTPSLGLGGMFGLVLALKLSKALGDSPARVALFAAGSLLVALLPAPLLARLARRKRPDTSRRRRWLRTFGLWCSVLAALAVLYLGASELLFPLIGDFDAEFLSVILVLVAPVFLARVVLKRAAGELSGAWRWAGGVALGCFAFLALSLLLVAGQAAVVSGFGGRLTPGAAVTCRVLSSPLNVVLRPVYSITLFDQISRQPASVLRSTFWRFELPGKDKRERAEKGELELLSLYGLTGPRGTIVRYYAIPAGGRFVSREPVYTTDPERKPPY